VEVCDGSSGIREALLHIVVVLFGSEINVFGGSW